MIIKLNRYATFVGLVAALVVTSSASGAASDLLLEYQSSSGMLPEDFGWNHEGRSLEQNCPMNETPPTCEFYGARDRDPLDGAADNDGVPAASDSGADKESRGGNWDTTYPPTGTNHNAPADPFGGYDVVSAIEPQGIGGTETYGEWIEFDDDGANLEHLDTNNGPPTPKGSQDFPGAPPYQTLRLVGGDGNGIAGSLPANASNLRNEGKIKIVRGFPSPHTGPVTFLIRMAWSEKGTPDRTDLFLQVDIPKAGGTEYVRIGFFWLWDNGGYACIPGDQTSPCGRFGVNNDEAKTEALMPALGVIEPQTFTTFRAACDPDTEQCTIWVNEENGCIDMRQSSLPAGFKLQVRSGASTTTRFGLISTADYTQWIDYLKVYDGIVPPDCDPCQANDPVFDVTGPSAGTSDGRVDELDLDVFTTDCYTGPAPPVGVFDALSDECRCMDLNCDEAIDHEDFGRFQACYTGADGILDTNCDARDPRCPE